MKRLILFSMMCLVAIASTAQGISGRVIDESSGTGSSTLKSEPMYLSP